MSRELINRITVKKDGRVFISSHSSNDDSPYHAWENTGLTEIYRTGGQQALDKEIISMIHNYCELRGSHPSVMRYQNVLNSNDAHRLYDICTKKIDAVYEALDESEKHLIYNTGKNVPESVKEYQKYEKICRDKYYEDIAKLLNPDIRNLILKSIAENDDYGLLGFVISESIDNYEDTGSATVALLSNHQKDIELLEKLLIAISGWDIESLAKEMEKRREYYNSL